MSRFVCHYRRGAHTTREKGAPVTRAVKALAAVSVVALLAAVLAVSPAAKQRSPAAHHVSARFVAEARAALLRYLAHSQLTDELALSSVPPNMKTGSVPPNESATTAAGSYNWAGYADATGSLTAPGSGTFSSVSGQWTVPFVQCSREDTIEAQWVGLDGFNDTTVEQDGTVSWCFEGQPVFFTWWEMYPSSGGGSATTVGTTVAPGDHISASVTLTSQSASTDEYTLSLTDSTRPANSFTTTQSCPTASAATSAAPACLNASAEWIVERPAFEIGIAPLADYATTAFTDASETFDGKAGTISSYSGNYAVDMVDATGSYLLDSVGPLTGVSPQGGNAGSENGGSENGGSTASGSATSNGGASGAGSSGAPGNGSGGSGPWGHPGPTGQGFTSTWLNSY